MTRGRLPPKPRDLGLLLWSLVYRVPVEAGITEPWIEVARRHCRMSPERLAALRQEAYAIHWRRMVNRRARRLAYLREHGSVPDGWTPLAPGEQDRRRQVIAMWLYWHTRAKAKARLRKRPNAASQKLVNAYLATQKIRSRRRRLAALDVVESMLVDQAVANSPKVSFCQWLDLQRLKSLREEEYLRQSRGRKTVKRGGA